MACGSAGAADGALTARVHATLWSSRANGPGRRAVIWLQGCTLGCRGCFNPASHDPTAGTAVSVADLAGELIARADRLDGLSVSGGEPFQQPAALEALLAAVRRATDLSILVFSGYRLAEIARRPRGPAILELIDVLVAGRYVPARHHGRALVGSANQRVHFLTPRHGPADLAALPDAELVIDAAGRVTVSGIAPPL